MRQGPMLGCESEARRLHLGLDSARSDARRARRALRRIEREVDDGEALWPIVWLVSLPFPLVGIAVEGVFALLRAIFMLPARLLGWRPHVEAG